MTTPPSAGNERIGVSDARRILRSAHEALAVLDRDLGRMLTVAREWEGNTRATGTDGGSSGSDVSDPTGTLATRPEWTAAVYSVLVSRLRQLGTITADLDRIAGVVRASEATDDASHRLARINATAGQCDACGRHHDGTRDDRLKSAPQTDERMYGPDCYAAWTRNLASPSPAIVRVFERMRAQRAAAKASA